MQGMQACNKGWSAPMLVTILYLLRITAYLILFTKLTRSCVQKSNTKKKTVIRPQIRIRIADLISSVKNRFAV